jgi:hypothetical protein
MNNTIGTFRTAENFIHLTKHRKVQITMYPVFKSKKLGPR